MARSLASRQSGMVAVLLNDLHNPFFAETFDGLLQAAESLGYRLLLGAGSARRQAELAAMRGFLEYRPDGIILLSPRLPTGAIAARGGDGADGGRRTQRARPTASTA